MKAVRIHSFGGPEVLRLEEVAIPKVDHSSVLLKVRAASVNPVDYKIRSGQFPMITQRELPVTLGRDVCGVIQGEDPDSEFMALLDWGAGGYAEYVAVPRALCVPRPAGLSMEDAAAVPLAAMTAWQGLFQYGALQRGQRVLIHGASGGVGHFAVQFAAHCGAQVFATASRNNIEFVRDLGASKIIDHERERFENEVPEVDLVFDLVGGATRERSWPLLHPGGTLVSTLGQPDAGQAARYKVRAVGYMTEADGGQLGQIASLIDAGAVHPIVSKVFALAEAAAAQRHLEHDHPRGKIVLTVNASG